MYNERFFIILKNTWTSILIWNFSSVLRLSHWVSTLFLFKKKKKRRTIIFLFVASVLDGFEKFLRISVKGFAGFLNAYIELVQTVLVPSQ